MRGHWVPGRAATRFIDVDSTICETYGLLKQGASGFAYTGVRGYHPLLATAAGTGDVLHARLRGGSANSGRGAAGFVAETVSRVRGAGASGQLTLRADSGLYNGKVVRTCRQHDVRFSITCGCSGLSTPRSPRSTRTHGGGMELEFDTAEAA